MSLTFEFKNPQDLIPWQADLLRSAPPFPLLYLRQPPGQTRRLLFLPPPGAIALPSADQKRRSPVLGCQRALELLHSVEIAESRLFSVNLRVIGLSHIFLYKRALLLPVFPLCACAELRQIPGSSEDFWESWAKFYHLPADLAATARLLFGKKREKLKNLLQDDLKREQLNRQQIFSPPGGIRSEPARKAGIRPAYPDSPWPSLMPRSPLSAPLTFLEEISKRPQTQEGRKKRSKRSLFLEEEWILGSDPVFSDFYPEEGSCAARHARLFRRGGKLFLEDLESGEASYVDGLRLKEGESCLLPIPCNIRLGQCLLRLTQEKGPLL